MQDIFPSSASTSFVPSQWNSSGAATLVSVDSKIQAAKDELLGGANASNLDSIKELADSLNSDANYASTITTALAWKASAADTVNVTGAQTITGNKTFSSLVTTNSTVNINGTLNVFPQSEPNYYWYSSTNGTFGLWDTPNSKSIWFANKDGLIKSDAMQCEDLTVWNSITLPAGSISDNALSANIGRLGTANTWSCGVIHLI